MDEVAEAMRTAVGSQELALRMKLGNDGFEEWKKTTAAVENAQLLNTIHGANLTKAQAAYVDAKSSFWSALAFAVVVLALCGVGVLIWVVA